VARWSSRLAPVLPPRPTLSGRSRHRRSDATSLGSPPEHSPARAHEAAKAIPLPGPFHTPEDVWLGLLETPKARRLPGKTGLPTPVLSPLVAFLRFQRTGCVPDCSCRQEPPGRLSRTEHAPKSTLLAPEAPTFSAFRVCFTPETPVQPPSGPCSFRRSAPVSESVPPMPFCTRLCRRARLRRVSPSGKGSN